MQEDLDISYKRHLGTRVTESDSKLQHDRKKLGLGSTADATLP